MADYTLDTLIAQMKNNTYKPRTEQEITDVANRRYKSFYDQQRLAANQAVETQDLALDRQLQTLGQAYNKQREASAEQYQKAYGQSDRQSLSRGLQRSSYNSALLGNISTAGAKAQQDITDNKQMAESGIGDQRTLLAQQLAGQLRQYTASQAADVLSYIDELDNRETDRKIDSDRYQNSLAAQIYSFANQEKQQNLAQQNWTAQFNENVRQFNENIATQSSQWEKTYNEGIRQHEQTFGFAKDQDALNRQEWLMSYNEGVRQFDTAQANKGGSRGGGTTPPPPPPPADDKDKDLFLKNFVNITNKTANVVSAAANALKPKPKKVPPPTKTKYVTNQLK